MHKHYLRLFICLFLLSISFSNSQAYPIDTFKIKGANWDLVNPFLLIVEDKNNNYTVNEVIKKIEDKEYKRENYRVFNSKYTKSSYWFLLHIKNISSNNLSLVWSFYNNNFGLDFYNITNKKKPKDELKINSQDHLEKRPFSSRSIGYPFSLEPAESKSILVKIYPENTNLIYFLSDVSTTEDVLYWEINYALIVGKYFGYILFMFCLNIFLFIVLRQELHFWHAMYILSIFMFSLNENMMDIFYLNADLYSLFSTFPKMFWLLISLCLCFVVFQKFTDQKRKFASLFKIQKLFIKCSISILFLVFLAAIFLDFKDSLFYILRLLVDFLCILGSVLLFYCCIYCSLKKDNKSLAFFISTAFLLAAFINYILDANFRINLYYIEPGNILIGLVIEITILTALFIWRIVKNARQSRTQYILQSLENQMLTKRLLKIQEEERNSIAREIHDGIGSDISGLKISLQNLFDQKKADNYEKQKDIISQISSIYQDLRVISHQLLPSYVEDNNLINLIKARIDIYRKNNSKINITLQQNIKAINLEQQQKLHIYRIISELLENAYKHSNCKEINLQIYNDNNNLEIMIEDDGIGYNILENHQGIGIRSVHSRIAFLKGKQTIESNKSGTTYIITIPL